MEKYKPEGEVSVWNKVRKIAEVTALAALMSLAIPESGLAKGRNEAPKAGITASEQLPSSVAQKEIKLEKKAEKTGRHLTINGLPATELTSKAGNVVTFAHSAGGSLTWVALRTPDNVLTYLDINADGQIERVVVNKAGARPIETLLDAFGNLDTLATEASLLPSDKAIIAFMKEEGKNIVKTLDMNTGEKTVLGGADAASALQKVQGGFSGGLDTFQ